MPPQPWDGFELTPGQQRVVSYPRDGAGPLWVGGLPGSGKSTALVARLAALLREGRRPYEILVLAPQRAQAERYEAALAQLDAPTRGGVDLVTFYGLARRSVALFWPLVAEQAGFARPDREPTFLTIETAAYFMWRIVEPLMAREGYFSDITIRRERLLSQLIDNLNKSALVGFGHSEIFSRLRGAWTGSPEHAGRFLQAQDCALRFREYCLSQGLLDFSLSVELYRQHLMPHEVYLRYFRAHYRHLLVDNLEENVPVAHDMIRWAAGQCASTVLVCDRGGGYRLFLGADARGARSMQALCEEELTLVPLHSGVAHTLAFSDGLKRALRLDAARTSSQGGFAQGSVGQAIVEQGWQRYWVGMIRWVAARIVARAERGTALGDMAIVAPYVSEVMRFAVVEALAEHDIPVRLLRPSRALREDPIVRGLFALVILAHPEWEVALQGQPYALPAEDVALALGVALGDLDPIRARRLAEAALPAGARTLADLSGGPDATASARDLGRLWEAVGYAHRQAYETLRVWLETHGRGEGGEASDQDEALDLFLSRLFGDLLSRPGYGFYRRPEEARSYGRLVESARKFVEAVSWNEGAVSWNEGAVSLDSRAMPGSLAQEYVQLILGGIASAEYVVDRPERVEDEAVLLAPAHAYLTRDVRSAYQFWIDLGSDGWWNRPNQPLTHPYVLSRNWPVGQPWRDVEEEQSKREALGQVVEGLAARCTQGIYLAFSELGLDGSEQSGRLQRAVATALRRAVHGD